MAKRAHRERKPAAGATGRKLMAGTVLAAILGLYFLVRSLVKGSKPELVGRAMTASPDVQQEAPVTAFEPTDWSLAPVAWIYVGTLVLLIVSCLVLIVAYPDTLPDVTRTLRINPPGPRLQTNPEADLGRFRAAESRQLNEYYWIDKQKGIAHVPIREAMKTLVQTGIDGFPKAPP